MSSVAQRPLIEIRTLRASTIRSHHCSISSRTDKPRCAWRVSLCSPTWRSSSAYVEATGLGRSLTRLRQLLRYEIEKLGGKATQVVESTDKARKKRRAAVDNTLIESNHNNAPVATPVVTPVKPPSPYKHFPTQMFVLFDSVNLPPVIKKVLFFVTARRSSLMTPD